MQLNVKELKNKTINIKGNKNSNTIQSTSGVYGWYFKQCVFSSKEIKSLITTLDIKREKRDWENQNQMGHNERLFTIKDGKEYKNHLEKNLIKEISLVFKE